MSNRPSLQPTQALKAKATHMPGARTQALRKNPSFFHYYRNSDSGDNEIENYVFTVTNMTLHTSARYRINAGGHVRILPETGNQ